MNNNIYTIGDSIGPAIWWGATTKLRWLKVTLTEDQIKSGCITLPPRLQQLWESNDGQVEWRDIEVEVE